MPPDRQIQQAIVLADRRGVRVTAASPDFDIPEAERIATLFGERPPGVACPLAHFACPFGRRHVAVVRVEDLPGGELRLGFRFLVLDRQLYRCLGDPFAISDRFAVNWSLTDELPLLLWPKQPLSERTLEELQHVLQHGDGPLLLGGVQALVDGNRLLVRRDGPDEQLARNLWRLLPERSRGELWPASFAFSNELPFHLLVMPPAAPLHFSHGEHPTTHWPLDLLSEEAVRDYPSGSYELNLQIAIESGDRAALHQVLTRRTPDETLRLALYMVLFTTLAVIVFRLIGG